MTYERCDTNVKTFLEIVQLSAIQKLSFTKCFVCALTMVNILLVYNLHYCSLTLNAQNKCDTI